MIRRLLEKNLGRNARGSVSARIPLPPEDMQLGVGVATAERYLEVGRALKDDMVARTNLPPTGSVLDIGCGSGRIARHFADHVRRPGRYVGMDIQKRFVDWCEKSITPANPAFAFYHQDIHNGHYNPEGRYQASEYRFPFEDGSFDLVFLTSVFTHMLPEDASNYLTEISRLLKPGGYCYSTWFLLGHDVGVKYLRREVREAQVGYGFRHCVGFVEECGLTLAGEPVLGRWHGSEGPTGQDILLLGRKPERGGSALPRYETAPMPAPGEAELEEESGPVRLVDPVHHALTLTVKGEPKVFRIAEGADIRANGRGADSSSLRKGQNARLRFSASPEGGPGGAGVAAFVAVRDRPEAEQIKGIIDSVDLEAGTVTLLSGGSFKTFELDPQSAKVRVNGRDVAASELREGHRASLRYVPKVEAIGSVDPSRKRAE